MIKFLAIVALVGAAFADPIPILPMRISSDHRIIGGEDTPIEEVPYQVSIVIQTHHHCGGSIIAKNWVLTAAHCVTQKIDIYAVRAGSSKNHMGGSFHKVSRIIIHEEYRMDSRSVPTNDIALFQVTKPFQIDSTRQTIELFESGEKTVDGTYGVITGWGTISPTSTVAPHILQSVSVPMISTAECKEAYANFTKLNPGQICAAYPGGGKDACQGDSGGPLVVDEKLAGVVSWGYGCARPRKPGVYTEVAYFRAWIDKTMKAYNSASSYTTTANLGTITLITIAHMALTSAYLTTH